MSYPFSVTNDIVTKSELINPEVSLGQGSIPTFKGNYSIGNASGIQLDNSTIPDSFFVRPIRTYSNVNSRLLVYDTSSFEIQYSTSNVGVTGKTFVIQHPEEQNRYLVHGCLEGPEVGVYYRGLGIIPDGHEKVEIKLPSYVSKISYNFSIHLTPIYNGKILSKPLVCSEIQDVGTFLVYGEPSKFYWIVHGERESLEVEPLKSRYKLNGTGPYTWLNRK